MQKGQMHKNLMMILSILFRKKTKKLNIAFTYFIYLFAHLPCYSSIFLPAKLLEPNLFSSLLWRRRARGACCRLVDDDLIDFYFAGFRFSDLKSLAHIFLCPFVHLPFLVSIFWLASFPLAFQFAWQTFCVSAFIFRYFCTY